ncbi:MAG: thioredoxin family protein [Eubacteriales bacterium]
MFGFGKKEKVTAECACGSQGSISDIEGARIIVLGACCKKSAESFANVQEAVKQIGVEEKVVNMGDVTEITKYGVMSTPALVIDRHVVAQGTLIRVEQAKELLYKNGFAI